MQVSLTQARVEYLLTNTSCRKGLAPRPYGCFSGAWRHNDGRSKDTRWAVHTSLRVQIGVRQFQVPITLNLVPERLDQRDIAVCCLS